MNPGSEPSATCGARTKRLARRRSTTSTSTPNTTSWKEFSLENWTQTERRSSIRLDGNAQAGEIKGKAHSFGGDWTSAKLGVLAKYLAAYTTALKDKPSAEHPFRKAYVDAFAGTGYRSMQRDEDAARNLLFPDLAEAAPQELLDGSARLALKTRPRFDRYIYFNNRLKSVFPGVAEPGVLRNSSNCPLYLLCFAAGNAKGAPIALKIANHLLKEMR